MLGALWILVLIFLLIALIVIGVICAIIITAIVLLIIGLCKHKENWGKVFIGVGGGILLLFVAVAVALFIKASFSNAEMGDGSTQKNTIGQNVSELSIPELYEELEGYKY